MAEQKDVALLTATTGEALNKHRLVRFDSSGELVYCDAGEMPLGPNRAYAADGDETGIELLANKCGTVKCVASAAISSARVPVYTADDGKVSTTNTGICVGLALNTASGDGSIVEVLPMLKRVPYVNTAADSVKGASSTTETDCGITFDLPASELMAGSLIRIKAAGIVTDQDSTPQCTVKLYLGTEAIATAVVAAAADNDECLILADVVVRSLGATGKLIGAVGWAFDAAGTAVGTRIKAEASEDTTSGLTVKCTVQFDASHADNKFRLDILEVEHLRPF